MAAFEGKETGRGGREGPDPGLFPTEAGASLRAELLVLLAKLDPALEASGTTLDALQAADPGFLARLGEALSEPDAAVKERLVGRLLGMTAADVHTPTTLPAHGGPLGEPAAPGLQPDACRAPPP